LGDALRSFIAFSSRVVGAYRGLSILPRCEVGPTRDANDRRSLTMWTGFAGMDTHGGSSIHQHSCQSGRTRQKVPAPKIVPPSTKTIVGPNCWSSASSAPLPGLVQRSLQWPVKHL